MTKTKILYWTFCGLIGVLSVAALIASRWLDYSINLTNSLPGTFYVIHKGSLVKKGDLVAFRWSGGATYPAGTVFIKQVAGIGGEKVQKRGQTFWIKDQYIGTAKRFSKARVPLFPAKEGAIASNEYFVSTPHPDSLDSRYALSGNVKPHQVIGRAYAIF